MTNTCLPRAETRAPAYPATYQPELAPAWLHHAASLGGVRCPDPREPFAYLELGCGQGFSSLLHAACYPWATFHVVDRDARAIDALRMLAAHLRVTNLHAHALDLTSLPASLTGFAFIAVHGVYSWVDSGTRATIRDLLAQRLASEGLCYVSYNCMPGWSAEIPLRRLLLELNGRGASHPEIAQLAYFRANPAAAHAVTALAAQPEGYIAQEYLAPDWDALWSVDVRDDMERSGLIFAGSATLRDFHPQLLCDDARLATINALPSERLRTIAMDFALNRRLGRDLFVRSGGPSRIPADPSELVVGCALDPDAIADSILAPRGRIRFHAGFIAQVREISARGPFSIGEAAWLLGANHRDTAQRNLLWLVAGGMLVPATARSDASVDKETANAWLEAITTETIPGFVPSPRLGSGVKLTPAEAAALLETGATRSGMRSRLAALAFG